MDDFREAFLKSEDKSSEAKEFFAWKKNSEVKIEESTKRKYEAIHQDFDLKHFDQMDKYRQKSRYKAIQQYFELKNKTDETKLEDKMKVQVEAQVELLGSLELYNRISTNLKDHKFEPYFVTEQDKLYHWRLKFFYKKFGQYDSSPMTWFTEGSDDCHIFETVPFQITKNFENVLMLACSKDLGSNSSPLYFEKNDDLSEQADIKFNMESYYSEDIDLMLGEHFSFGDVAHIIVARHSTAPPSLFEIAMKTVLLHKIPVHDERLQLPCKAVCCTSIKQKELNGLYTSSDDGIPANLSPLGRKLFKELKKFDSEEFDSEEESRDSEEESRDSEES